MSSDPDEYIRLTWARARAADRLLSRADEDRYAALHVATALVAAGRGEELLELVESEPAPITVTDPILRREAELQRLRLAIKVCREPETKIEFVGTGTSAGVEAGRKSEGGGESSDQDRTSDKQVIPEDANLHAIIVSNLERMQIDLADLLTRWRESSPSKIEGEDENSVGSVGGR